MIGYAVCGTPEEDFVNVVRRHGVKWSHLPESNWWPFDYESNALPTELRWLTALNGLKQIEVRYQFFIRLSRKLSYAGWTVPTIKVVIQPEKVGSAHPT